MPEDPQIQNDNLVNDEVAQQLANLQAQTKNPTGNVQPVDGPGAKPFVPPDNEGSDDADTQQLVGQANWQAEQPDNQDYQTTDPEPSDMPPTKQAPADQPPVNENQGEQPMNDDNQQNQDFQDDQQDQGQDDAVDQATPAAADDQVNEEGSGSDPASTRPVVDESDPLYQIKRQALDKLRPLVDKIGLPPAKRYDVLMEMIQASDDDSLMQQAYDAAETIDDEELRAQALLEIVNEVDYLTKNK